jgi:hypothetical protein
MHMQLYLYKKKRWYVFLLNKGNLHINVKINLDCKYVQWHTYMQFHVKNNISSPLHIYCNWASICNCTWKNSMSFQITYICNCNCVKSPIRNLQNTWNWTPNNVPTPGLKKEEKNIWNRKQISPKNYLLLTQPNTKG